MLPSHPLCSICLFLFSLWLLSVTFAEVCITTYVIHTDHRHHHHHLYNFQVVTSVSAVLDLLVTTVTWTLTSACHNRVATMPRA
jgi:hypothetical protein